MNVENIGGVIEPVGNNAKQKLIAKIMQSKFCFGGGKFREENFQGFCESVYLGFFFLTHFLKKIILLSMKTQKLAKIQILTIKSEKMEERFIVILE